MKIPDIGDIVSDLSSRLDNTETTDTDFGDPENANVDIPTVTTLTGSASYYASPVTHAPLAKIDWSWTRPPMYDEDGILIDPDDPEIADDINLDPVVDYMLGTSINGAVPTTYASTNGNLSITTDNHPLGVNVTASIYPVLRSGITGPVSTATVTVEKDTTPPPVASIPIVTSSASMVTVEYDGKDNTGIAMADDAAGIIVKLGTSNPPTDQVGVFYGNGPAKLTMYVAAHTTVYVQLFTYDYSGNISTGSDIATHVVKSVLDDTDLLNKLSSSPRFYTATYAPPATDIPEASWWIKADNTVWQYVLGTWVQQSSGLTGSITAAQIVSQMLAAVTATISDLSADAATIQTLYSQAITASTLVVGLVKADKVEAGAVDGMVVTGAIVQTAYTGSRVVLDSDGMHVFDATGVKVELTPNRTWFSGEVEAENLTVNGPYKFADNGEIAAGNVLVLGSTISAPVASPTVSNSWIGIRLKDSAGNVLSNISNICSDNAGGSFSMRTVSYGSNTIPEPYQHASTGLWTKTWSAATNADKDVFVNNNIRSYVRMTYMGSYLYFVSPILGNFGYDLNIVRMNSTGTVTYVTTIPAIPSNSPSIGLTNDGTNLVIAWKQDDGKERFASISSTTWTLVTPTVTNPTVITTSYATKALAVGSFDFGSTHYVYCTDVLTEPFRVTSAAGANVTNYEFAMAYATVAGLWWYSGAFYAALENGYIFPLNGPKWTDAGATKNLQFAYSWYDAIGTVRETQIGPKTTIAAKKRVPITVQIPSWSVGGDETPNLARIYGGVYGGTLYLQAAINNTSTVVTTLASSGTTPSASNTFPVSTPAQIKSSDGSVYITGAGLVKVVPGKFRGYPIKAILDRGGTDTSALTASNHKSIPVQNLRESTGEWVPTFSGDCLVMPYKAWVKIVFHALFNASSSGNRMIGIWKNPSATTYNNSAIPTVTRLAETRFTFTSDTSSTEVTWEGSVNAGDLFMFIARTTASVSIGGQTWETWVSATIERMLD